MQRSRLIAVFALATHLVAALVVPVLHRAHHNVHGNDHVHGPTGTVYVHVHANANANANANDDDFVSLDLHDVAHAGSANVDCALSEFTLIDCSQPVETFGDELLARGESAPPPSDLDHERGALEHLTASLLSQPTLVVRPPALRVARYLYSSSPSAQGRVHARSPHIRGPPRLA